MNDHVKLEVEKLPNFLKLEQQLGREINLEYKTPGSVAFDLVAAIEYPIQLPMFQTVCIPTGVRFKVPEGYYLQLCSRSSAVKTGRVLVNSLGILDQDFRGGAQIYIARMAYGSEDKPTTNELLLNTYVAPPIEPGERIAQAVLVKMAIADFHYTQIDTNTERGTGGFGSTGKF